MTLTSDEATELFRLPPHRHLAVTGGEVAYRRVGQGPDVLFVHGFPASGATFRGLLPRLAPHVTCHLIDLLGAGQSRFDRTTRIDLAQHVDSIRRVVDSLNLESVGLVGHDSGGMLARHAMAGDPRLRSMALVNTELPQGLNLRVRQFLATGKLPGFEHVLAWACMRPRLRRVGLLLGDCFTDHSLIDGPFEEFFLAPLRDDRNRRWAAGELLRNFDRTYVTRLAEVHAKLNVPVQLAWGENDPFFPIDQAREMVSTFSDAQLHVVANAKLFAHEERPQEVAEAILPTLLGNRHAGNAATTEAAAPC